MIVVSLATALISAYAGILALATRYPAASLGSKTGNNVAAIAICGPVGGLIALGLIWGVAKLKRR